MTAGTPETLQTVIHTFCVRWAQQSHHPSLSSSIRPLVRSTVPLPILPRRVRRSSAHIPGIILVPRINSVLIPIIHLLLQRHRPLPTTTSSSANHPLLMPTQPNPPPQLQILLPNLLPTRRHSRILPHPPPLHHPRMIPPTNPHRDPTPDYIRNNIPHVKHPPVARQRRLQHLAADRQAGRADEQGQVQGAPARGVDHPVEGGCEEEEGERVEGFVVDW